MATILAIAAVDFERIRHGHEFPRPLGVLNPCALCAGIPCDGVEQEGVGYWREFGRARVILGASVGIADVQLASERVSGRVGGPSRQRAADRGLESIGRIVLPLGSAQSVG